MTVMDALQEFMEQAGIRYRQDQDTSVVKTGFAGKNGLFDSFAEVDEDAGTLLVITLCPVQVPDSHSSAIADLMARINWAIELGNFQMHAEKGVVAFRTSVMFKGTSPDPKVIEHVVFSNWAGMDRYFPAITAVLHTGMSPRDAFELAESPSAPAHEAEPANQARRSRRFGGRLGGLTDGPFN